MKSSESFVKLKYEIITSDSNTWHLCETYPAEVRSKWAWRCAADVEHLAKGYKEAEHCIEVAKRYRDGLATKKELEAATAAAGGTAAIASYSALAGRRAVNARHLHRDQHQWNLYISWLIEELCKYEESQCCI